MEQASDEATGCSFEMRTEDGRGDTTASVAAYERLKSAGAKAIVTNISSVALALAQRAKEDHILLFADAAHPDLTVDEEGVSENFTPMVFRHSSISTQEGEVLAKAIESLEGKGQQRVAAAVVNNDYGISVLKALRESLEGVAAVRLVNDVRYEPTDTEFLAVSRYLTREEPTAVVLVGYSQSLGQLINFLRDDGYAGEILCSVGLMATRDAANVAGPNLNGVIFNAFLMREDQPAYAEFKKLYREKFATDPPQNAVLMYNTGLMIREAMGGKWVQVEDVSRKLVNMKSFEGAGERIEIRPNGDLLPELVPARLTARGVEYLQP